MAAFSADFLQWLENTAWAVTIRQSSWLYPALEVLHIAGIILLAGTAFLFDVRLLGFARELPVQALANLFLFWSRRGLLLVVASGFMLFITDALALAYNATFRLKMILLALACLNALVFQKYTFPLASNWNTHKSTPLTAKAAAIFSIILWLAVIICGRWLAY